jgi:Family of unknown function (DUF6328)
MITLVEKLKLALDESRMLILGAQILLGFQFRAILEQGFATLPSSAQAIKVVALGLLLLTIALIMWPGAYHRIVWQGRADRSVHEFTTRIMDVALLPFLLALSLEFYVMSGRLFDRAGSVVIGGGMAMSALFFWYGLGVTSRALGSDYHQPEKEKKEKPSPGHIFDKVEQVLIEARVVLPGVQALLGFQLATMLLETFNRLPASSRYCHLASLLLMGFTMVLLMSPAA